ncbi:hypothetical protein C9I86_05740 [Photobacterium sp. NCIMB 13483]|uniref:type II toxin-antitoxin system RelE/ParE family toxin n=1 Tax=Photobacterium sp. NCIMB 13483 TaxID=2022103 RepID=UPI000D16F467|nr:type II toxin-antitoxin system RelE/ParE family toxin [Photobacterium sp. NCIMB 13483]PST93654.1 hypothetical protein C9I86_05740 [Photobacterium sp. NCIMB 13483]
MDHVICINQNSFPAVNSIQGAQLFDDSLQGVLELQDGGQDRFLFYLDTNSGDLSNFEIAPNFTYGQFIEDCPDQDLAVFLSEVEDKCPALDSLSEEQQDEMTAHDFYIPNEPVGNYPDVYSMAWSLSGYLLSINTGGCWTNDQISIARSDGEGRFVDEILNLRNISSQNHGIIHYNALNEIDLESIASPHLISESLLTWFNSQTTENKIRIVDKIRLSCNREFQGSKPLFETLTNGNGLREIRFSAYAGGAIRILFKHFQNHQQALLVGFIKHSDSEGYTAAMRQADDIYNNL